MSRPLRPPVALEPVGGIRHVAQLLEYKARDDQRALDDARLADIEDAAVYDDAGVEHLGFCGGLFLPLLRFLALGGALLEIGQAQLASALAPDGPAQVSQENIDYGGDGRVEPGHGNELDEGGEQIGDHQPDHQPDAAGHDVDHGDIGERSFNAAGQT